VKVCGLTRVEDAIACAGLGVDWIGLNFHPGSVRFVRPEIAAEIMAALLAPTRAVGVFVDRPAAEVAALAGELRLGVVQLHGQEPPEDLLALKHLELVRAFGLDRPAAWDAVREYLGRCATLGRLPDAVLLDSLFAGRSGGTGATVADEVLDDLPPLPRLILAGGLTPENVAERVARARPWMVDVASGVESAPGVKDPARIAAFVKAARSVPLSEST
jgi:phosphoribosylanthranilate isomerase